ncbi:MAG: gliding motility lipoprotein GldD [Bacteroidetes bacterium]|nr:gliding motility lipoprotein GldD [Bacteroidota bacterium]
MMKLKKMSHPERWFFLLICMALLSVSCKRQYTPKPRGYFRIDTPDKTYILLDSIFPFTFEYPVYARLLPDPYAPDQPFWMNIDYPRFHGKLHLSYKTVNGNLSDLFEDSRTLVFKHIPKATSIEEQEIRDKERDLYGMIYQINGSGTASPYQFFITDSCRHFVRVALYFNIRPNNDSLAPVIDFIKQDIMHMIETFKWKDNPLNKHSR